MMVATYSKEVPSSHLVGEGFLHDGCVVGATKQSEYSFAFCMFVLCLDSLQPVQHALICDYLLKSAEIRPIRQGRYEHDSIRTLHAYNIGCTSCYVWGGGQYHLARVSFFVPEARHEPCKGQGCRLLCTSVWVQMYFFPTQVPKGAIDGRLHGVGSSQPPKFSTPSHPVPSVTQSPSTPSHKYPHRWSP